VRENLEVSMKWMLGWEGGYVNHKKDPGGATNKGVTQRVYDRYRVRKGLAKQSVKLISKDEVVDIYVNQYWTPCRCDDLPSGVDYAVFDFAVNSGVSRAVKELQKLVGAKVDGVSGEDTLSRVSSADAVELIEALCVARLEFCKRIRHRETKELLWKTFGRGWTRRIMGEADGVQSHDIGVIDRATALLLDGGKDLPTPTPVHTPTTVDEERSTPLQSKTIAANAGQMALVGGSGYKWLVESVTLEERLLVIGLVALGVGLAAYVMRERLRAWADGWR
jgi:lysozyme family protein